MCLSACSNGRKLIPYVLVNRKRPITNVVEKFTGKLIINWAGTTWMNDTSTADYLRKVIGTQLFGNKRLLVWDAFNCHKSDDTKKVLKDLNLEIAIIPGGCTKFIQVF